MVTVKNLACRPLRKGGLSPPRRRLLELMQRIAFGRIEDLTVHDGEPNFDPAPSVVRKVKIGADNGPRQEMGLVDFGLRREVVELLEHLDHVGNGVVRCIEVKYGMPFTVDIEEPVEA